MHGLYFTSQKDPTSSADAVSLQDNDLLQLFFYNVKDVDFCATKDKIKMNVPVFIKISL